MTREPAVEDSPPIPYPSSIFSTRAWALGSGALGAAVSLPLTRVAVASASSLSTDTEALPPVTPRSTACQRAGTQFSGDRSSERRRSGWSPSRRNSLSRQRQPPRQLGLSRTPAEEPSATAGSAETLGKRRVIVASTLEDPRKSTNPSRTRRQRPSLFLRSVNLVTAEPRNGSSHICSFLSGRRSVRTELFGPAGVYVYPPRTVRFLPRGSLSLE